MSKNPSGKSIIANFGALSVAGPEGEDGSAQRVPVQPVARVGAGVIGATQRTLSDIREERDRLLALVAAGGGLELDPSLIDPSPFPDRLPDDSDVAFEALKKLISEEGQKIPNSGPHACDHPGALSDRLWAPALARVPRPGEQGQGDPCRAE